MYFILLAQKRLFLFVTVMLKLAYGALVPKFNKLVVALIFTFALTHPLKASDAPIILALGDSLTAGYGLEDEHSFPTKLQSVLHANDIMARVINGGVSGDTTAGGLSRLDWMLNDNPDLVIIELGANDGLRGLDPDTTNVNLEEIIKHLKKTQIKILLTGMLAPPNLGADYSAKYNAIFPTLADRYDLPFYPFFLEGVVDDPSLNQDDGIHPNEKGVDIVVAKMLPYVKAALNGKTYP